MFFSIFQVFWYFGLSEIAAIPPVVTFAGPGDVDNHTGCLICTGGPICASRLFINRIVVSRIGRLLLASGIEDESNSDPKDQGDK